MPNPTIDLTNRAALITGAGVGIGAAIARELAPEIRTLSIMPGVIETRHHEVFNTPERMQQYREETPLGHNGTPDDVANTVLFLVSDQAAFLNGSLVDINGGRFLR